MERIIGNLEKVKLKLDEAFFYLDEIEEILQEDSMDADAGARVGQAGERLAAELLALSGKVMELQEILQALDEQDGADGGSSEPESGRATGGE
ncbi:MAG: hypothetical protein ACYC5Q_14060 [Thermoleophilia bacterium]